MTPFGIALRKYPGCKDDFPAADVLLRLGNKGDGLTPSCYWGKPPISHAKSAVSLFRVNFM